MMKTKSAFTLIELLIVIAIIAILAAILFPVFATAREKARQSACASNEKQIGLAYLQYLQDNDETTCWTRGWTGKTYPYFRSMKVFLCPGDVAIPGGTDPTVSYMLNSNITGVGPYGNAAPYAQVSTWTAPTMTVLGAECIGQYKPADPSDPADMDSPEMFTDVFGPNPNWGRGALGTPRGTVFNSTWQYAPTGRHNNGSNVLLLDGHVKWLKVDQIAWGNVIPPSPVCNEQNTPTLSQCHTWNDPDLAAGTSGTWADGSKPTATVSPV